MRPAAIAALAFMGSAFVPAWADGECTLTAQLAAQVRELVSPGMTLVYYCKPCGETGVGPHPLRVREVALAPSGPSEYYLDGKRFSREDVKQAKDRRTGPLAEYLKRQGSDEDWMMDAVIKSLESTDAQRDHDLGINGEHMYADYLYLPEGKDRYGNLARRLNCAATEPRTLSYTAPKREPGRERPPEPFVADVTGRCYDGTCPGKEWTSRAAIPVRDRPGDGGRVIARLEPREKVTPRQSLVHVVGVPAKVVWDHRRFLAGDTFYVLDSQGEGYYRVWHYGEVLVEDLGYTSLYSPLNGKSAERCQPASKQCWAEFGKHPGEVAWSLVQRATGEEGWVRADPELLDGLYVGH